MSAAAFKSTFQMKMQQPHLIFTRHNGIQLKNTYICLIPSNHVSFPATTLLFCHTVSGTSCTPRVLRITDPITMWRAGSIKVAMFV
jgi:hypothetical protein